MSGKELDIVLPCYNPTAGWSDNLLSNIRSLQQTVPDTRLHVYLVNDGSVRGVSSKEIDYLKAHLQHFTYLSYETNKGKGFAVRYGISQTHSELCIYTDIDFPYIEESFLEIYKWLASAKYDIVVGVRSQSYYDNVPKTRVRISKTLRFVAQKLLSLPVNDTQAGLKGFNRKGKEVFLKTDIDRYLFDLEFLFMAAKDRSLRIKPVNVTLKPGIVFSSMNAKVLLNEGGSFMKLFLANPFSRIRKR